MRVGDVDLANASIAAALIQSGEFKASAFGRAWSAARCRGHG